jgi:hypothetical protein
MQEVVVDLRPTERLLQLYTILEIDIIERIHCGIVVPDSRVSGAVVRPQYTKRHTLLKRPS